MTTSREAALLRENLMLRLIALARDMGAATAAAPDVARRLVEAGAEVRPDGRVRLPSGESIADAIETMRVSTPGYFIETPPAPPVVELEAPVTTAARRKRASALLAKANSANGEAA